MKKLYNHVFSIAFTIDSEFNGEQSENIGVPELIEALEKRLADLKAASELEAGEAFNPEGDVYEVPRYEVQTQNASGHWFNEWQDDDETPRTFTTHKEAQAAIDELLADVKDAVAQGHMSEEYDRDNYRIVLIEEE